MDIGSLAAGDIILYLVLSGVFGIPIPNKYNILGLGKTRSLKKGPETLPDSLSGLPKRAISYEPWLWEVARCGAGDLLFDPPPAFKNQDQGLKNKQTLDFLIFFNTLAQSLLDVPDVTNANLHDLDR